VWSLIAPVLALFVGGFAAGQLTGPVSRITGALHGAVMWSLATVASLALVWTMVAALLGGACLAGAQVPTTPGAIEQGYGQHGALEAVEDSGKAMLGLFFSLLVGLGAAVGGSVLGVRGEQKRLDREMRGQTMQSLGTPPV
jgi:hypothetical protein